MVNGEKVKSGKSVEESPSAGPWGPPSDLLVSASDPPPPPGGPANMNEQWLIDIADSLTNSKVRDVVAHTMALLSLRLN